MLRETLLIFFLSLGLVKLLYEFRSIPWVGNNLSIGAALVLIYVPILHNRLRSLSLHFFEKSREELFRSLKIFLGTALIIFPPFLAGNHFYQLFLGREFAFEIGSGWGLKLLTQSLLVAFPEEWFFRGWLQGLLGRRFSRNRVILLSSLLFAFSHSLIMLQWWHFAIFFPACLFGWLREKTGAITASILFHTVSNLWVAWIGMCYR